jgi:hypothetical protein
MPGHIIQDPKMLLVIVGNSLELHLLDVCPKRRAFDVEYDCDHILVTLLPLRKAMGRNSLFI